VSYAEGEVQDEEITAEETPGSQTDSGSLLEGKRLVGHWKFDNNFEDSSGFENDAIKIGNVTFANGVAGQGAKFDGKSYLEVKDSDSLDISSGFTFSVWVYKDEMRGKQEDMAGIGVPYLVKMNDQWKEYPYTMWEWWDYETGVTFNDGEETYEAHSGNKQVDMHKWTMVTVTYDGKTIRIFHNKEMVKSELVNAGITRSSQPLYIGFGNFMNKDNFFKGIMDDLKIYNYGLTYEEVENEFDEIALGSGKSLIDKPRGLVAYYKFDGDFKDSSNFKNDGTAVNSKDGIKFDYAVAGKGAKFNGASYIEVKDSDSLDLDKGFTIGTWLYKEKSNNNQPVLAKYGKSHYKKDYSYALSDLNGGSQRLDLTDFTAEGKGESYDSDVEIPDGRWYYYTAAYDGSTVKIYINGVLKKTEQFEGDISNSSGPLWIGGTTDTIFFKGMMDELRIYNYALKPTDIKTLMNRMDRLVLNAAEVNKLKSFKLNSTMTLNSQRQFINGGTPVNMTAVAAYASSNTKVATVSKGGKVKAVGKGTATITVTQGLYSSKATVKVP
jgi:hypothetical protein